MTKKNSEKLKAGLGSSDYLKLLSLIPLLAYAYYPTFVWMVERWMARDSYYAHGFLIPAVMFYWIFKKRKTLAALPAESHAAGIPLIVSGVLLHVASSVFRVYFLSAFSFVFVLLGIALILFGKRIFKEVWFPICFLFLMIPLPLLVISQTTLKMKFFVSEVSAYLINASGIQAVREGSYIMTPKSLLLVGDPCSGLRSFLAFICLGFVFAYEGHLALWKRIVLVVSGLPLAILSNVVRVYSLGMLGEIYGSKAIEGKVHDASGVVVFIIAFATFMLIRRKLEESEHVKA